MLLASEHSLCRKKEMTKSGYKGISRIDQVSKNTHGWYVRVRLGNITKAKFISDNEHGGKDTGLMRAVECRNRLEEEMGKPRTDWVVVGKNPRNKTGVVGVRRTAKKYKGKDGTVYLNEVYEVSWNAGREKMGRTSVSVAKYGELGAFRRACAIRRQKELLMYGGAVIGKWAGALEKVCA